MSLVLTPASHFPFPFPHFQYGLRGAPSAANRSRRGIAGPGREDTMVLAGNNRHGAVKDSTLNSVDSENFFLVTLGSAH